MKAANTDNGPKRRGRSRRPLFRRPLDVLLFVLICASPPLLTLWYLDYWGGDGGHATFRLTDERLQFWHQEMERFCDERGRAPTSAGELRDFVRDTCEKSGASYHDVARDAWGYELEVTLTRDGSECVLRVRSPGPDGEFGPPPGRRMYYLEEYYHDPACPDEEPSHGAQNAPLH